MRLMRYLAPLILVNIAGAEVPSTAPVVDAPAVAEVRATLIGWNHNCPAMSDAEFRRLYHTAGPREALLVDFQARDDFEQCKVQKRVLDKWGSAAEASFAHLYETDTIEDDQTAQITVNGDHALISWKVSDIDKTHMVNINGHWLMDMHPTFDRDSLADPNPKEDDVKIEALMQQANADLIAGKFKTFAAFFADFEPKYNALVEDDD